MSPQSALDPQGPSQPNLDTAYEQPSNPAQSSSEHAASKSTSASLRRSDPPIERRKPNDAIRDGGNDQSEATPTSVAYGVRDSSQDAGESVSDLLILSRFNFETLPDENVLTAGVIADGRPSEQPRRRTDARGRRWRYSGCTGDETWFW